MSAKNLEEDVLNTADGGTKDTTNEKKKPVKNKKKFGLPVIQKKPKITVKVIFGKVVKFDEFGNEISSFLSRRREKRRNS